MRAWGIGFAIVMRGSTPINRRRVSTIRRSPGVKMGPTSSARNGRPAERLVNARTKSSTPLIGSKRPTYATRTGAVVGRRSGPGLGGNGRCPTPRRLTAILSAGAPLAATVRRAQSVNSTKRSTLPSRRACRAC